MNTQQLNEHKIMAQISRVILLRIKTVIIQHLKKEDIAELEQVMKEKNINLVLNFAHKKIPQLSQKIYSEIELLAQKITQSI